MQYNLNVLRAQHNKASLSQWCVNRAINFDSYIINGVMIGRILLVLSFQTGAYAYEIVIVWAWQFSFAANCSQFSHNC